MSNPRDSAVHQILQARGKEEEEEEEEEEEDSANFLFTLLLMRMSVFNARRMVLFHVMEQETPKAIHLRERKKFISFSNGEKKFISFFSTCFLAEMFCQ